MLSAAPLHLAAPIYVSAPTLAAGHATASSLVHAPATPIHVTAPAFVHFPVKTAPLLTPVHVTGPTSSPIHILGPTPPSLDGDGYVDNVNPGDMPIYQRTWNYNTGAFDQKPAGSMAFSLTKIFSLMWGKPDDWNGDPKSTPTSIAGALHEGFVASTTNALSAKNLGVGGGGQINFTMTTPSQNELRTKEESGNWLDLKYLGSGSEDFYVAHDGPGADPHVTITFDVEVDVRIAVSLYVTPSNTPVNTRVAYPLWVDSAVVQLHNAQVNSTHSFDTSGMVQQINSQSIDISTPVNNLVLMLLGPTIQGLEDQAHVGNQGLTFDLTPTSVEFYLTPSTLHEVDLNVLTWGDPLPGGPYDPQSLSLVRSSITSSTPNFADAQTNRYYEVTLTISRSHLTPIRVPYNGPIKDPDFPKYKFIEAPNIPYGVIASWNFTVDLASGAIAGDATGTVGQTLQVGSPSGPHATFTISLKS
jgi:hypothetical protein